MGALEVLTPGLTSQLLRPAAAKGPGMKDTEFTNPPYPIGEALRIGGCLAADTCRVCLSAYFAIVVCCYICNMLKFQFLVCFQFVLAGNEARR